MSLSRPIPDPGKGLRFLSFDGGGIRAVSQALMVREMMNRVQTDHQLSSPPRVCDYFDMVCGSGFGGILAIMCGILKMTGDQLVHEFVSLCKAVFADDLDTAKRTAVLEQEMKAMIGKYSTGGEERRMFSEDDTCKTFVCAAAFHNTGHPRLFRNYRTRENPSVDCMLWEAACATTSMPDLFKPISIGDMNIGETFVGGDLRWNNPTDELTREAAEAFKGRRICSIINIGSGHSGHLSLSKGLTDLFPRIALDCERVADDMERRFGNTPEVFWRLSVEQGLQGLAVDLSNLDALVAHTHSYLRGARTTRSINLLLQDIMRRPERIPVDGISGMAPAVLEVLRRKLCPPPTQHFTGRRSELERLTEYFSLDRESLSCHVGVLFGIGGGGKSQIGLEFVRRSQSRFTDVFFVDASDKFTLENDLKTIAIDISDEPTVEDALHLLRTTKEEWLLFLDNADDPSLDLRPYISWPRGNILITTRNHEARIHAPDCNIWVDKLELDDAIELLLRGLAVGKTMETYEMASEIVQTLGCLALAVNQARGFLVQDICTLNEYLPIYKQNRKKLLEDRLIQSTDDYEHTVYTTWTISFDKLSPPAVWFLELLCFMHHEGIPARIFEDAWKVYKQVEEDAIPPGLVNFLPSFEAVDSTWDIRRFRTLVKEILSYSLIEFNTSNRTFSLHPLVQQWAQSQCHHAQDAIRSTQTLLSLATPKGGSTDDCIMTLSLLPHVRASVQTGLNVHLTLLHNFGHIYRQGGMFREYATVCEQETEMMQKDFGLEHPATLRSMGDVALAYSALGRYKDALNLEVQILELRRRSLGEEHPGTLANMNNLAMNFSDLGQHKDALKLKEQALALSKRIQGEEHPCSLTCMNNLAMTYSDLGRHKDALKMQEQVLALNVRIQGEEHPDTLVSMNSLARIYSHLGQHRDALKLAEQGLALRRRILGQEHPDTLTGMNNLAQTYSDLGQHKDALKMKEQVLVCRTKILGQEHPHTLESMNNLAFTYSRLGQHRDALQLYKQTLALETQIQGEEHPHTLATMSNLAMTYSDLGLYWGTLNLLGQALERQHKDALELHEETLRIYMRVRGPEHPDTIRSSKWKIMWRAKLKD
ncbi:hypothetical protein DL96DRAFT_1686144 [Flagelloscypha sp. PMI_526]|nr:hypothetical protein DL96DRAFT_1686144 [Flagelloscypha sp. PMI_526]